MERKEKQKRLNSIQISCLKDKRGKKKKKKVCTGLRACSTTALLSGQFQNVTNKKLSTLQVDVAGEEANFKDLKVQQKRTHLPN